MKRIACAALFLLPVFAAAQTSTWEVTPFVGYMRGGSIEVDDSQLTDGAVDVKVEESSAWGLKFDKPLGSRPNLRLQFLFERGASQLEDNRKLFGETPSGPVPAGSTSFTDISATYLHVGLMKQIGRTRTLYDLQPYVAGGLGITQVSFHEIPLDDQVRPSLNLGAGMQWALTERLGVRFETRLFYSNLSSSSVTEPITNRDCVVLEDNPCIRTYSYPNNFLQVDFTAGLSVKF